MLLGGFKINFIECMSDTSKDVIHQLINEEIITEKTGISKRFETKEDISIISSLISDKKSFQIMINFSEELVKKISTLVNGGIPIVLIDIKSKQIIMEISKLIISNSVLYLDDYDETCRVSPPVIIEGSDITYSTDGLVSYREFDFMNEEFSIAIFPVDMTTGLLEIKDITQT